MSSLVYLISERKVDAFFGDVDWPDLGVDDYFVRVGKATHIGSNLNE